MPPTPDELDAADEVARPVGPTCRLDYASPSTPPPSPNARLKTDHRTIAATGGAIVVGSAVTVCVAAGTSGLADALLAAAMFALPALVGLTMLAAGTLGVLRDRRDDRSRHAGDRQLRQRP